ncbi:MAG: hypothetical protein LBL13_14160 [Bacteroidales bacterium]|nr:hypothetical protein [Bacteroidales bacterium]
MLPDFPNLTKCKKCNNIFWISDLKPIGEYGHRGNNNIEKSLWETAESVIFLDINDLFVALGIENDSRREKTIRIWIWWAFNDRIRETGEALSLEPSDKERWENNCRILINILDDSDFNEKLMIADLYRNLGEFDNCIEIIDNIKQDDINWAKDPMKYLAKKNIPQVFTFQLFNLPEGKRELPFFQVRGELKEKNGNYQGALDDYEKAIFLNESVPAFYVLKAGANEKLGNLERTLENFSRALSINPDYADAYINRSLFFRRRRKFEEARCDYEKAISLEPRSFKITTFSEIDIFKYGKFQNVINNKQAKMLDGLFREGTLYVDVKFKPHKKGDADSYLYIDAKNLPYFIFRKRRWKPILNKRFVKFEFVLAKCISYVRVNILRKKIKYIDNAVLN